MTAFQSSYAIENSARAKAQLEGNENDFNNSTESWESLAYDRPSWRHLITNGAHAAEERRSLEAAQKRAARNDRVNSTNSTKPTHFCPTCGRGYLTRIGLISHLWTSRSRSSANYDVVIFDYEGRTTPAYREFH